MSDVLEVDALTNVSIKRQFTNVELEQRAKDVVDNDAIAQESQAAETANAAATADAIAHAKSLGFTDEMIRVMYPNLGA